MKTTRKVISVVLAIAMVLTTFGMVAVSAAEYGDTAGHWAESYIGTWSDYGVIQGDGGYFRPDDAITRAEVAQVTQNVIGYTETANNGFVDVPAGAWYEDAVLKLAAAGTLTGNGDGTMSPDNYMTREDTMTMLARAYGLTVENSQAGITQYADYESVSDYATGYVGAMTAAGYVSGYEDGTIRPQAFISRAEFVKILDNMIKLYITEPGTYGPGYYGGIAMVKAGGVTLSGVVGNGVVVSPQASGSVSLQDCQFSGNTVNLSADVNITSNTGISGTTQEINPNTYYGNGPYSGSSVGGSSGSGTSTVTVTFYYDDGFTSYEKVTVTKGGKVSANKVPNPTEDGDDNWNGLWYKSEEAALSGTGTAFDPTSRAISTNTVLYAGREKTPEPTKKPVPTTAPAKPTAKPGVPTTAPGQPTAAPGQPTVAPGQPTAAPGQPTAAPTTAPSTGEVIEWDITEMFVKADGSFDTTRFPEGTHTGSDGSVDRYKVTPTSIVDVNGLTYLVTSEEDNAVQKSVKKFDDGYESAWSLKTNGAGTDTNRAFVFTPKKSGTLKVYATSGSGSKNALLTVNQDGAVIGTHDYAPGELNVYKVEGVKAGKEVRLVAGGNIQYFNIVFEASNEPEPTAAPAQPTDAPSAAPATAAPTSTPVVDNTEYLAQIGNVTGGTIELSKEAPNPVLLSGDEVTLISQDFENVSSVADIPGFSVSFIGEEGTGEANTEITDQILSGKYADGSLKSSNDANGYNTGEHNKVLKVGPYTKVSIKTNAGSTGVYTYSGDYYVGYNDPAPRAFYDIYDSTSNVHIAKAGVSRVSEFGDSGLKRRLYPLKYGDDGARSSDDYWNGDTSGETFAAWIHFEAVVDLDNKTVTMNFVNGKGGKGTGEKAGTYTASGVIPDTIDIIESANNCTYVDNITLTGPESDDPAATPAPPTEPPATATPDPVGSIRAKAGTTVYVKGTPGNAEHVITAVTAAGASDIQKLEDNLWSFTMPAKDVNVDVIFGEATASEPSATPTASEPSATPAAPEPSGTPGATAVPGLEDWSFNGIPVGTTYATGDTISGGDGKSLTIGVAEADTVNPTIKERAAGDNYLEFNDSTTAGTSKQDSWAYTSDTGYEGNKVVFSADYRKSDTVKDTILFRVYDTNNTTADNSYATDSRSFELKTGDSGSLAFVDYYSADSAGKAAQVTVPGFSYTQNEWFSVKVEYERTEKAVYVYANDKLLATYTLGTVGSNTKVTDFPVLAPTKVACFTPGGGAVVLGVDNINVESVSYEVKEVPVTGMVYTTFSDDMRNKPEAYDSSLNASISFTKKGETSPTATAAINADGTYTVQLMSDATYEVAIDGAPADYTLSELSKTDLEIPIKADKAEKNVLFVHNLGEIEYKDTIEVGADKECNTINKALSLVRKMTREADQWVTIKIDPGSYEEQLFIDVDNVALVAADENNKPTVQWYYGIGYVYYSAEPAYYNEETGKTEKRGWYNCDYAVSKTVQSVVENWGSTLKTTKKGFRAENINFINTFNKYITQAEIDDGVTPGGNSAKDFSRSNINTEVRSKTATERAAAIYADGSEIELYRCTFSSSQDTFGTSADSMYVKECDIAGNTDYICGGDNCYFESCNLIWTGYSDTATGGYLTACKTSELPPADLGYYFKDCTIQNSTESGMKFAAGSWGRSWGGYNCQVIFDNTSLASGVSKPGAWIHMGKDTSGNYIEVNDIGLYVINGVNGADVSSNTADNPHGALATVPAPEDYFGGWTPVYYTPDTSKIAINKAPAVNGSFSTQVNGVSAARAVEGDTVTVVPSPDINYELDEISVVKTADSTPVALDDSNSFIMPVEEVTVTVTFKAKTMGIYSDWNQGQAGASSTDGSIENVMWQEKDSLHVISRNVYKTLDSAVTSGTVVFTAKMWLDPADSASSNGFRIYLENENASYYQDSANSLGGVIAEVLNSNGGSFCTGPNTGTSAAKYSFAGATAGWFTITITVDYSAAAEELISVTVDNADGTQVVNEKMGAISGIDTGLKQIRLVDRSYHPYFADISVDIQP